MKSVILIFLFAVGVRFTRASQDDYNLGDASAVHILDEELHNSRRLLELAGSRRLEYTISAFEEDYNLELELHPHLNQRDIQVFELNENNELESSVRNLNCIYKGKLKGSETSKAVVSFCEGRLLGHIVIDSGRKLTIRPLRENRRLTGVYLYDVQGRPHAPWKCGVTSDFTHRRLGESRETATGTMKTQYFDVDSHTLSRKDSDHFMSTAKGRKLADYFFEVLSVVDHHLYLDYLDSSFYITLVLFSFMSDLYIDFPNADTITMQLVGIIIFRTAQPWEESSSCTSNTFLTCNFRGDPLPHLGAECCVETLAGDQSQNVDDNNVGSLAVFREWGNRFDNRFLKSSGGLTLSFDAAHLLTGLDLRSGNGGSSADFVVGLAYVGTVCAPKAYGTTQFTSSDLESVASVFAHEIGHNLGFNHDQNSVPSSSPSIVPRECRGGSPTSSFIMDIASSGPVTEWSLCSSNDWDASKGACSPSTVSTSTNNINSAGYCGNGVLDDGEECDCGLSSCGDIDPCCDGDTCQYALGKTCAANDLCCAADCVSVKANNTVCRPAQSECDDGEVCDGVSKTCPVEGDTFAKATGDSCVSEEGGSGTCYREKCLVGEELCQPSTTYCSADDCVLKCAVSVCGGSFFSVKAPNGFECDTGKGCFEGDCIDFAEIPLSSNCSNFQLDPGETDVDCGGLNCLGCVAGKSCLTDDDCLGTRKCIGNETAGKVCSDPQNGLGDQLLDLWNQFLEWIQENPYLAAGIGVAILFVCASLCLAPLCSNSNKRQAMKNRFRTRGNPSYGNPPYGNAAYRNEEVIVAVPVGKN